MTTAAKMAFSMPALPPTVARHRSSTRSTAATPSTSTAAEQQQPPARRAKSVRFTLEPVARDVQRSMEQELWGWLRQSHSVVRPLAASARGPAYVMERLSQTPQTAAAAAATAESVRLVVKAVAVTLPPHRRRASSVATTATEYSEDEDRSWSRAQLAPDVALALWEQRRRRLRHVAAVIDVFTLASMVLAKRAAGSMSRQPSSVADNSDGGGGAIRVCTGFLGSSCGSTASGRVPMPVLDARDLDALGWKLDLVKPSPSLPQQPQEHSHTAQRGSRSRSPRRDPAPLPHPTVFLYAREYVDHVEVLWSMLQDRWGRERLPVTVMPTWVNVAAVYGDAAAAALADAAELSPEALAKLRRHLERWLKGSSAVDKAKRRAGERTAAAQSAQAAEGDRTALTAHDAADVAWGVCSALARLHRAGLTHGNLKPNNVLVGAGVDPGAAAADAEAAAQWPRTVHVTDHLLPLVPDRLVEPGAVLRLSVPVAADDAASNAEGAPHRRVARHGYVCLKLHEEAAAADPAVDASTLAYLLGGGPPPPPPSSSADATASTRPTLSLSGCYAVEAADVGAEPPADVEAGCIFMGGVEALVRVTPYEGLLFLHLAAPECVLIAPGPPDKSATVTPRVWVDTQHPTTATDIYALGVLLYMMLVGRLPPLPRFRRALLGEGTRSSADVCGTRPSPAYMSAVRQVVHKLYANAANRFQHDPAPMLEELAALLESAAARAHVPLVLALARAGVRPVTMQILIGMLHHDPAARLSLAQLQEHAFFRAYGRRRHQFRAMPSIEPPQSPSAAAAASPLRHSTVAALQRRFMPRNMGATAAAAAASVSAPSAPCRTGQENFPLHHDTVHGASTTRRAGDAAALTGAAFADAEQRAAARRRSAYVAAADTAGGAAGVRPAVDRAPSRSPSAASGSEDGEAHSVRPRQHPVQQRQRWAERRASATPSPSPEPHLTRAPPAMYLTARSHRSGAMAVEVERDARWGLSSSSSASPSSPHGQAAPHLRPAHSPSHGSRDAASPPAATRTATASALWRGPAEASQHRVLSRARPLSPLRDLTCSYRPQGEARTPTVGPAAGLPRGRTRTASDGTSTAVAAAAAAAAAANAPPWPFAPRRPTMRRVSSWMTPQPSSVFVVALVVLLCVRLGRRRRERARRRLSRRSRSRRHTPDDTR